MEESNPPLSAPINIKDEPIDEGYDAALLPQNSAKQIKEELEHQEVCVERICLMFTFNVRHRLGILRLVTLKSGVKRMNSCVVSGGAPDQLCLLCRRRKCLHGSSQYVCLLCFLWIL